MNRQQQQVSNSHVYNNNALEKWVDAFDAAAFQVYKTSGTQRRQHIYNEICDMEKTYITNTDEEIDNFNTLIDIHMNQVVRIEKCQKENYERDTMRGIGALFHEHPSCKTKKAFVCFLHSYNEVYNVDIEKYVDEFGNINKTPEGFDFIYENVFLNNPLFNALQTDHIKRELVLLKVPIIIQMCKN